jgi:hypothetical protein
VVNLFISALIKAFLNKSIIDTDDIVVMFNAHFGKEGINIHPYKSLYELLELLQSRISSSSAGVDEHKLLTELPQIKELMRTTKRLLEAEEKRVPFYGAPGPERELLEDILALTSADANIVHLKLARLAELIRARQETLNVLGEEKGQARRLVSIRKPLLY